MQDFKGPEQEHEILKDIKKGGRERPWRWKKVGALKLRDLYTRLGNEGKASRLNQCASVLSFKGTTLHQAMFCYVRLCPVCAMRRSEKVFHQVSRIMNVIEKDKEYSGYKFIFLTLTIRNVSGGELSAALDKIFEGFHLLTKYKAVKDISKGWFRALEVTHNWDRDDYHPHLHMIIAVDERYITEKKDYITHDEWKRLWQKAMDLDYDPFVYVRVVRPNWLKKAREKETIRQASAVAEVSKYSVKDDDFLSIWTLDENKRKKYLKPKNEEEKEAFTQRLMSAVSVLDSALHKRRLAAFGGIFKKIHKELDLGDPVDGDLLNTDAEEVREDLEAVVKYYHWNVGVGNYVLFNL